jgi:hypothetical protein
MWLAGVVAAGLADPALASEIASTAATATISAINATPRPFLETALPPNSLLISIAASRFISLTSRGAAGVEETRCGGARLL